MDIPDVARLLPHEPPILMLDRVVDIEPGVSGVGKRFFHADDACFRGHFPWRPVLPGVLAIEAMAQTALVVLMAEYHEQLAAGPDLPLGYLSRVEDMSFQRAIEPGQEISFEVRVEKRVSQFTILRCRATRAGKLCVKGRLAVALDRKELEAALARRLERAPRTAGEEGD